MKADLDGIKLANERRDGELPAPTFCGLVRTADARLSLKGANSDDEDDDGNDDDVVLA